MKLQELFSSEKELENYLFEMANLDSKDTGIERVIIWVSPAQSGAQRHSPRVKVSSNYTNNAKVSDFFVLSIADEPEVKAGESHLSSDDFQQVKQWVRVNKDVLLKFWNSELVTRELLQQLKKV